MTPSNRPLWALALLTFCGFLYFWGLGDIPFYTKGEPREAVELQEILIHGDWILPMRNGDELPSKPPLFHWLGALTALGTGQIDELAARFPSALLATLTVLGVFWVGAERWGTAAGVFAGFALASNFEWMRAATTARVDMTLTAFLIAAILAFWVAASWRTPPRGPLVCFYAAMGLAALGKGPVGILLPALVAFVYLVARRDLSVSRILSFRPVAGGLLAITIPGVWYALAVLYGGDAFVHKHLYVENIGRFFSAGSSGAGHEHPFYYLVGGFASGFAPWSGFVIPLGFFLWRHRDRLEEEGYLFPLVWAVTVFAFYSLSESKRTVYLLPMYPAVALMLGAWWRRLTEHESLMPQSVLRVLQITGFFLAACLVLVLGVVLAQGLGADPLGAIRPLLHPKDQGNIPVVQNMVEARFTILTIWVSALLPVLLLFAVSVGRGHWGLVFASLVAFIASTAAIVNGVFHPALAWQRTFKPFLEVVRGVLEPGDQLMFHKTYDYGAIFYSGRRIPRTHGILPEPPTDGTRSYVLLWSSVWNTLPVEDAARMRFLHQSDGTGPKGADRLVLACVKTANGACNATNGTTTSPGSVPSIPPEPEAEPTPAERPNDEPGKGTDGETEVEADATPAEDQNG